MIKKIISNLPKEPSILSTRQADTLDALLRRPVGASLGETTTKKVATYLTNPKLEGFLNAQFIFNYLIPRFLKNDTDRVCIIEIGGE